ncbi:MAG: hypothetical protein RIS84_1495 [Pseudomonadota bacterium]|jgi:glutamyl-tRNA reductase
MQLIALGLNHTTAPVEIREKISFATDTLSNALNALTQCELAKEAVIVSTCNRTEIYCSVEQDNVVALYDWLAHYHALTREKIQHYLYTHTDHEAVRHLLRVACGLDSMILGEPQILGQIKTAYSTARTAGTIGKLLGKLFEYSFSVAKQVRTDTAIGSSPVSVAFAAVRLAQQIFGDLQGNTALLIGAGETIELAARHLHEKGLGRMIVANRTVERARLVAKEFAGYAITLEEIPKHLEEADVVITSTASPVPILTKAMVEQAVKARKHRPIFMVDIAVPRDIEAEVAELEDVYLYSVDDLNQVIQENLRSREQAALKAEEIIDTEVSHFMGWMNSLDAVSTICALRDHSQETRNSLANKAKRMLDSGKPAYEVIDYLAHTLTNSLMHTPCAQLRQAGYDGRAEVVLAARQLFQLKD